MIRTLLLTFTLLLAQQSFAQLNMELRKRITYSSVLNDVWGYVDPANDSEYAIVGKRNGLSFVNVTDPANSAEVAAIPGQTSVWRDMKTWESFCYAVADQGTSTEGITVIDLAPLPDSVTYYHFTPNLPGLGTLLRAHNIWIDESGYAYLAGSNLNDGGVLVFDVDTPSGQPEFVAAAPNVYAHDVFVRNNLMYTSDIYDGNLSVYDVSNKQDIRRLGFTSTPFRFTHNAWLSDDGNVAFTTDELPNAPVAAYDVSDPTDIKELDQFRPAATAGQGVLPHNVHVWDDWLVISYYSDGIIIADASRPHNIVEVGNWDTFTAGDAQSGAWGAYPYLPSGTVLGTDMSNGLFVLTPDYVRAAWLEGRVTDAASGLPLNDVAISIETTEANSARTDPEGAYATGLAAGGTYSVSYSKENYVTKTVDVSLENGILTIQDVALESALPRYAVSGKVLLEDTDFGIPEAVVELVGPLASYTTRTDAGGEFSFPFVFAGDYDIYYGAWGYSTRSGGKITLAEDTDLGILLLTRGYQDDFAVDLGWTTASGENTRSGFWVREEPAGTVLNGALVNPELDVAEDVGEQAFVTGNGGGGAGTDDIDGGFVRLFSPVFDLSDYVDPELSFSYWFFAGGGNTPPNDELTIELTNGTDTVLLARTDTTLTQGWTRFTGRLDTLIETTATMQLIVTAADALPGHVVEAGFDAFLVTGDIVNDTQEETVLPQVAISVAPNPSADDFRVRFDFEAAGRQLSFQLFDIQGRLLQRHTAAVGHGTLFLGRGLPKGSYLLRVLVDDRPVRAEKLIKQ